MASVKKKEEAQSTAASFTEFSDQLWYTWSDIGIDPIRAGFRIRAASTGLRDFRSELVQRLDPYQRYSLPKDADRSIDPHIAPVCLTLIDTGEERILVRKAYTGKDGVGRYGAFFVHLLANLPEEFSVADAIALWQSPFWQDSDKTLKDRRSTHLERVMLAKLRLEQQKNNSSFDNQTRKKIETYLPYVIQAYLTKTLLYEQSGSQQNREKIYIAAPDSDVALLIQGLTNSLPIQLVKCLTFSTYENDIKDAKTEIIGTCWLTGREQDQIVTQLLPAQYYQDQIALNCYTGISSPLENHPLFLNNPSAAQYIAQYGQIIEKCACDATNYFIENKGLLEFDVLLKALKIYPDLSVKEFLKRYKEFVIGGRNPQPSDLESALTPRTLPDYEISAMLLSLPSYQQLLINQALTAPNWWPTHKQALGDLHRHGAQVPLLVEALAAIALQVLPIIVESVKKGGAQQQEAIPSDEILLGIVDMMRSAAPPNQEEPSVWLTLLNELLKIIQPTQAFSYNHWSIYAELMRIWAIVFPPSEENNRRIAPLLFIPWAKFGNFLTLRLPLDWVEIATNTLIQRYPQPSRDNVYQLAQQYHPQMKNLFGQLAQNPQRWSVTIDVFDRLVAGTYQQKMSLLFVLLDSPMGKQDSTVKTVLQIARLTIQEKALFLEHSGTYYLSEGKLVKDLLNMFTELANHNLHQEKMRVLFSWLGSPHLAPSLNASEKKLASILVRAALSIDQISEFFKNYGEKYIPSYPGSPTLINLFETYARSRTELRISFLNIWLQCDLEETLLNHMLEVAYLTRDEKVAFLQYYGERYLLRYPQSQLLRDYVEDFLNYLPSARTAIFKGNKSPDEPSITERFLWFLYNFLPPSIWRDRVLEWCNVALFVRQPSILRRAWYIAPPIGRLLNSPDVQPPMSTDLIRELAAICITNNENEVPYMINNMCTILTVPNIVQLLYNIAENLSNGISQKKYAKALLVPYIHYTFDLKVHLPQEQQQEFSVETFLNNLLQNIDKPTLKWLNKQAKKWPAIYANQWRRYIAQYSPSGIATSLVPLSLFQHIQLFWERTIAFRQMHRALKDQRHPEKRILQVGTDYITTLSDYSDEVPKEYWQKLENVLASIDLAGETSWRMYEVEQQPQTLPMNHVVRNQPKAPPRSKSWWKRIVMLTQLRMALRSGRIGRIVRIATENMIALDKIGKRVPDTWWRQIDTAFDIFIALEVEYEETDQGRNREQDIVAAGQKLERLVDAEHPAPRLTVHEWRRIKIAMQYVANQKALQQRQQKQTT